MVGGQVWARHLVVVDYWDRSMPSSRQSPTEHTEYKMGSSRRSPYFGGPLISSYKLEYSIDKYFYPSSSILQVYSYAWLRCRLLDGSPEAQRGILQAPLRGLVFLRVVWRQIPMAKSGSVSAGLARAMFNGLQPRLIVPRLGLSLCVLLSLLVVQREQTMERRMRWIRDLLPIGFQKRGVLPQFLLLLVRDDL